MLGTLEPDKKPDWKKYISPLVYAYNSTRHETTKYSPFELMFGRKAKLPVDAMFETPTEMNHADSTTDGYIDQLKKRLEFARETVSKHTEKAREKQKSYYDRKAKASNINVGDKSTCKDPYT